MLMIKNLYSKTNLIVRILIGIVVGVLLGVLAPSWAGISILGEVFVSALKGIAPLLVFILILSSIAGYKKGQVSYVKNVVILYLVGTFLAAVVANFADLIFHVSVTLDGVEKATKEAPQEFTDVITNLISSIFVNPITALSTGNYLSILFWSALIGFAMREIAPQVATEMSILSEVVNKMVRWIINTAPIGIAGLVFHSVATSGFAGIMQYGALVLQICGCMLFVAFIVYPLMAFVILRQNPYPLVFYTLKQSAIPAFFTRSSAANIPVNMKCCDDLGLNKQSYSISIPLGATINMGGAAITITLMTLAAVNSLGMHVSITYAIILSILSALAACGASGVAGGSLLLIPLACNLFGISTDVAMQIVAIGFIIGVIQDSVETALNSSTDLLWTSVSEFHHRIKNGEKLKIKELLKFIDK
ncbi:MAG: serine/threonine transporter SstT [Candidatus Ancillula sp.]|jgi:serine/threonine transporter|nr:serine/threonine transporter SstT [Candidatus Ancillula sp.]